MKKKYFSLLFVLICCGALGGCSENGQQSNEQLRKQVDSLEKENARKDGDINDMMSYVAILADGLDSIAKQEELLFYTNTGKEGIVVDREQLKKNLEMFENTLNTQKQRIAQLVDSLKVRGENLSKLNSLVTYLNQQINEKDALIKALRSDIDNKNINISQLQRKVNSLTESNTKLSEKVERQVQALTYQTEVINEGYVKVGSKKTLTKLGLISGGLLRKTKVNHDAIDKSKFMRVDIRNFTEITVESNNPKILTQMPASSYKIERRKESSTIYVLDPTVFWSISNYLIIETK